MIKRLNYSREFKLEAVRLLNEGKKKSADLARELGIKRPPFHGLFVALPVSATTNIVANI